MWTRRRSIIVFSTLLLSLTVACAVDAPRFVVGLWKYGGQIKEGSLTVGDVVPDLSVYDMESDRERKLDERLGDRPLVLVFGSCT